MNRRNFCLTTLGIASSFSVKAYYPTNKTQYDFYKLLNQSKTRTLNLLNSNTGERFHGTYWRNDRYDINALIRLDHLLRDHRKNQVKIIDTNLFNLLFFMHYHLNKSEIVINSAYRTEQTNLHLRKLGYKTALKSYHTKGQALDLYMPNTKLKHIKEVASSLKFGGVGYYPKNNFVHVDTGPVRYW